MEWTNSQIAAHFDEIADYYELAGESPFRIRAYRTAAARARDHEESLAAGSIAGRDLTAIEGIGDSTARMIGELVSTGKIELLEKLRSQYPPSLRDFMKIPGMGAKKAAFIYQELKITDLVALKAAAEQGKLRELKGFGAKTEQTILHGIEIATAASERMRLDRADKMAAALSEHLSVIKAIKKFEFAGSLRRRRDTVGDLDILAVVKDNAANDVMDAFGKFPEISEVIARGETKMSVRLSNSFQCDLRIVPQESWGAALQYFTGSQQHNIRVRSIARDKGYKLNEYGLFPLDEGSKAAPVPVTEERDVYRLLGLTYVEPECRESRFEFDKDFAKRQKSLVHRDRIVADLHMHTTATDGTESIEAMAAAAAQRGYTHIAITDHSQRVSMAHGLDSERLLAQWKRIDKLNREGSLPLRVLKGVECDILESGELDLPDKVLAKADWVLASVHYGQKQSKERITQRVLGAIANPYVTAIAHPTGRLIGRRDPYAIDLEAVFEAAAKHRKIVELNSNPHRLDLSDVHCAQAAARGILITINTDAHSIDNLDLMHYGVSQARRAGLAAENVINTWPLEKLLAHLSDIRGG